MPKIALGIVVWYKFNSNIYIWQWKTTSCQIASILTTHCFIKVHFLIHLVTVSMNRRLLNELKWCEPRDGISSMGIKFFLKRDMYLRLYSSAHTERIFGFGKIEKWWSVPSPYAIYFTIYLDILYARLRERTSVPRICMNVWVRFGGLACSSTVLGGPCLLQFCEAPTTLRSCETVSATKEIAFIQWKRRNIRRFLFHALNRADRLQWSTESLELFYAFQGNCRILSHGSTGQGTHS